MSGGGMMRAGEISRVGDNIGKMRGPCGRDSPAWVRNPFPHPGLSPMTSRVRPARVAGFTLLSLTLFALAAGAGRADDPPAKGGEPKKEAASKVPPAKGGEKPEAKAGEREKEIATLEKQLADLQAQLKALKEPPAKEKAVTPAEEVIPTSWVNQFQWRCIGPATMGGRVTAISVFEAEPTTFWVATASGGLLKTTNNGISYEHQFDREATVSIGAVCVAPSNKDVVWVGTGENNPRNSVSFGDGVYKSTDGGKTWKNMGLKGSYQVGKIAIHPTNP